MKAKEKLKGLDYLDSLELITRIGKDAAEKLQDKYEYDDYDIKVIGSFCKPVCLELLELIDECVEDGSRATDMKLIVAIISATFGALCGNVDDALESARKRIDELDKKERVEKTEVRFQGKKLNKKQSDKLIKALKDAGLMPEELLED